MLKLRVGCDRRPINARDHVERTQVASRCWRVCFNRADNYTFVGPFEQITDRRILPERFDADAKPRSLDLVTGDQFGADLLCHVNRNSEAQPAIHAVD